MTDGEGCFRYNGTGRVSVTNSYPDPLRLLGEHFGGSIRKKAPRPNQRKSVYEWEVSGKDARFFADRIGPFLMEKREQASLMIRACEYQPHSDERAECVRQLKRLKHVEHPA